MLDCIEKRSNSSHAPSPNDELSNKLPFEQVVNNWIYIIFLITDIFLFLQAIRDKLSSTLATASHVEHTETIILREVFDDGQRLKTTAAQAVQIQNALIINSGIILLVIILESMLNKRAFDAFVTFIIDMKQILSVKLIVVHVIILLGQSILMHSYEQLECFDLSSSSTN